MGKKIPQDKGGSAKQAAVRSEDANRFYGIVTRSKRLIYIIDVSGSMKEPVDPLKRKTVITGRPAGADEGPAPGKTRLEVAQNELKRAVRNLPSDAYFDIIFFSHGARLWRPKMTKAALSEKKAALIEIVDDLPYRESKRLVLTGNMGCGRCSYQATAGCQPLLKTADGKVYPLIKNSIVKKMQGSDAGSGFKVSSRVTRVDGVKFLQVTSFKVL